MFYIVYSYRIAYSVYEIQRMLDKYANTNVAVKISYDIACTLETHLKVRLCCLRDGCKLHVREHVIAVFIFPLKIAQGLYL
jgi:hypothetical protein